MDIKAAAREDKLLLITRHQCHRHSNNLVRQDQVKPQVRRREVPLHRVAVRLSRLELVFRPSKAMAAEKPLEAVLWQWWRKEVGIILSSSNSRALIVIRDKLNQVLSLEMAEIQKAKLSVQQPFIAVN